jgi:hypothetical protein
MSWEHSSHNLRGCTGEEDRCWGERGGVLIASLKVSASKLLLFFEELGDDEMDKYEKYWAPPLGEDESWCKAEWDLDSTRRPEEEERRRLGMVAEGRVGVVHVLPEGVLLVLPKGVKWVKPSGKSISGDELSGNSDSCPSNGLFKWIAYAVGETIDENEEVFIVRGEVEIVNGIVEGGIAKGLDVGGWKDSSIGEMGSDVYIGRAYMWGSERWGENGDMEGIEEERGTFMKGLLEEKASEGRGGGTFTWERGVLNESGREKRW